jgi:hypothetical protein
MTGLGLRCRSVRTAQRISVLGLLFLAGCGRDAEMGGVTGTVKLDGKPVENARLEFHPKAGNKPPSYGMTDENGYYSMDFSDSRAGVFLGEVTVQIWTDDFTKIDGQAVEGEVFPSRYNSNSELTRDVQDGSNTFDFDLKSDK